MPQDSEHPFEVLKPDFIMDAVESQGYLCDCRTFALNSYENRVYQVGIEENEPLIVKFYRPDRWSDAQILEEHAFCFELAKQELPVVAPILSDEGKSLHTYQGFRFALYPRQGGQAPELDNLDNLFILGRLLGRIHLVGLQRSFTARPKIDTRGFGYESVQLISDHFMPAEYKATYNAVTAELLDKIDALHARLEGVRYLRVHGDCHVGNILWRNQNPHFVDFDDCRMAPAVQDFWMLLCGDRQRQTAQLNKVLEGYCQFCDFQPNELLLIEALRALRMLYHCAWIARRWGDPAFPAAFPWFNTTQYWGEQILALREQVAALNEPALSIHSLSGSI